MHRSLSTATAWFTAPCRVRAEGLREFAWFGFKEALSCVFAGGFFLILMLSRVVPTGPVPRYDAILRVFRHTRVHFTPWQRRLWMPLPLSFLLTGFFLWLAENAATFLGAWKYPDQHLGWRMVHAGKIGSWALLVVMTFVIVADLKQLKSTRARGKSRRVSASIHLP